MAKLSKEKLSTLYLEKALGPLATTKEPYFIHNHKNKFKAYRFDIENYQPTSNNIFHNTLKINCVKLKKKKNLFSFFIVIGCKYNEKYNNNLSTNFEVDINNYNFFDLKFVVNNIEILRPDTTFFLSPLSSYAYESYANAKELKQTLKKASGVGTKETKKIISLANLVEYFVRKNCAQLHEIIKFYYCLCGI
jgi:hypothetical protein